MSLVTVLVVDLILAGSCATSHGLSTWGEDAETQVVRVAAADNGGAGPPPAMADEQPAAPTILLWPGAPPESATEDESRPWLEPYTVTTEEPRGAVVICPGGGYSHRAPHEAAPIARRFNEAGFHAFVLHYRVAPHRHPAPLMDAARALRIVRQRAGEWNVKPDHIAILGFSAGGHLAASLGVHFDDGNPDAAAPLDRLSSRPDALILCYPVITFGEFGHRGSQSNLLGADPPEALVREMSLELQVTEWTPPAFLWHTADDKAVPVENSLLFARALGEHKVAYELHVYPEGPHGLGLATDTPHIATWATLCCEWLGGMGW